MQVHIPYYSNYSFNKIFPIVHVATSDEWTTSLYTVDKLPGPNVSFIRVSTVCACSYNIHMDAYQCVYKYVCVSVSACMYIIIIVEYTINFY